MYYTEENTHYRCTNNNLFDCGPPPQHIHWRKRNMYYSALIPKYFLWKETCNYLKFKEYLSCFKHQIKIADCVIVLWKFLPQEISPLREWSTDSTVAFPCKTLKFSKKYIFIEIMVITLAVYKYINCFVDKLLEPALVTNYTTNYSIIIIIIIIITIIIIIIVIIMMMIIIIIIIIIMITVIIW